VAEIKQLWQTAKELVGEDELSRRFRSWITSLIRDARMKSENLDSAALFDADVARILADLNKRTKSRFLPTDKAKSLIIGMLKRGYLVEDFFRVHEVKCLKWGGDEKWQHNLRPSTLYRPCHFDEYLAEWWKMDRKRSEVEAARKSAVNWQKQHREDRKFADDHSALIAELNGKAWHEFDSWVDFMRWTVRFPTAESLEAYPMPERIRRMRVAPKMLRYIAVGNSPAWAEAEYQQIKEANRVQG
jgi:uncharacterized phage protein (TIGR02220 family)